MKSIFPKSGGKPKWASGQADIAVLRVVSEGWWSPVYRIFDNDKVVVIIHSLSESGTVIIKGREFSFDREGWGRKKYFLTGQDLAAAARDTGSSTSIMIKGVAYEFMLKQESAFRRKLVLYKGDQALGTLSPGGLFERETMIAELPGEMPLPVKVFLIWLVLLDWREQQQTET